VPRSVDLLEVRMASMDWSPGGGRGSNRDLVDYSAAARAAFTIPAPKKELRLALP
jgi:hypothetical protein